MSTMFAQTFCYVSCASHVERAVRATEDVDKGVSADRRRRFTHWEMGKIIALVHGRGVLKLLNRIRRTYSARCHLLRAFDALPHEACATCIRRNCVGWPAMSKRQRVEWLPRMDSN